MGTDSSSSVGGAPLPLGVAMRVCGRARVTLPVSLPARKCLDYAGERKDFSGEGTVWFASEILPPAAPPHTSLRFAATPNT